MTPDPSENASAGGVVVSLSSAAFGFYSHAGFMAELHKAGIFPAQIAGTSAGALTALLCGTGMTGEALVDFFLQKGLRSCFWDWMAPLRFPGVATSLICSGILSGGNVVKFFRQRIGSPKLEEMKAPRVQFAVTNLTHRASEIVSSGDAVAYAVASCAIPGLFCNQEIDGQSWCDGGVANHVPFSHWLEDESVHTIVLHRMENEKGTEFVTKWPTLSSGFAASHHVISDTIFQLRLEAARRSGKRVIEIVTETPQPRPLQKNQHPQLVDAGRRSGIRAVEQLRQALA